MKDEMNKNSTINDNLASKHDIYRMDRRTFVKLAGATAGALAFGGLSTRLIEPASASFLVPQTPLPGRAIPKYVESMPVFGPASGGLAPRVDASTHTALTVSMQEIQQMVLPASMYSGLPDPFNAGTYVWTYKVADTDTGSVLGPALYPGVTVEAERGTPITVTYVNDLLNTNLQSYITVDQTLHWANPLGLPMDDPRRRLPYTGPVPVVPHLHGGEVPSASDGGPDAWFTPGYEIKGPAWALGASQIYSYPNGQEATTLFYHDHVLGATRLNLYTGLAAFYLIRDQYDTGVPGTGLNLPAGPHEVEIAIQDRMFDTNGQLLFPDGSPAGLNGPPPNPTVHPFWIPEFFGDIIVVNGKTWPFLNVEPRRYRLRFVNGSNARFYSLFIDPKVPFWQIGSDGGLLDKPVMVKQLFIAPGERADVIVDFTAVAGQNIVMTNSAKAPFPKGAPPDPRTVGQIMQFRVGPGPVTDTSFNPALGGTLRGNTAQPPLIVRLANGTGGLAPNVTLTNKRMLTLNEILGPGGPLEVVLNNTKWIGKRPDGTPIPGSVQLGPNWLTELPRIGSTEQWDIINLTADAHPIHLHLVQFQLINRQAFNVGTYQKAYNAAFPGGIFTPEYGPPLDYNTPNASGYIGGNPDITPFLQDGIMPPDPNEIGWKDTFKMFPGQVTRIVVRWAQQDKAIDATSPGDSNAYPFDPTTGPGYVWHCHIVDHEDNEMMRPYKVQP